MICVPARTVRPAWPDRRDLIAANENRGVGERRAAVAVDNGRADDRKRVGTLTSGLGVNRRNQDDQGRRSGGNAQARNDNHHNGSRRDQRKRKCRRVYHAARGVSTKS